MFGIKLSLENLRELLTELQNPQDQLRFIHVAGTNGKGSTCAFMEAALREAGFHTGLFTSPHLISYTERIRCSGQPIKESEVANRLAKLKPLCEARPNHPTFFEITVALAFLHFTAEKCDIVVLETGMGGRLDATNVVTPIVSVITPISYDHEQWLGDTLEKIAGEKAGIIKPGIPVVWTPQPEAVDDVLEQAAHHLSAPIHRVEHPWLLSLLGLRGPHQEWNAGTAATAIRASGLPVTEDHLKQGFAKAFWPARFQKLGKWVLDGAHNLAGATTLAEAWVDRFGELRATLLFSAVASKDLTGMLSQLLPLSANVILAPISSQRAVPVSELEAAVRQLAPDMAVETAPDVRTARALAELHTGPYLCAGSLFLCGELLSQLDPIAPFEASLQ